jgi:hypothetical protein
MKPSPQGNEEEQSKFSTTIQKVVTIPDRIHSNRLNET